MVALWFQRFSCLLLGMMFPLTQIFGNGLTQPTNKKAPPCGKAKHVAWNIEKTFPVLVKICSPVFVRSAQVKKTQVADVQLD